MPTPHFTTEQILSEVKKLQYFFALKREIRYKFDHTTGSFDESVADHVYGMHIVSSYFIPLENPDATWDRLKIFETINWHDADEIETGDTISWKKTDADRTKEAEAIHVILEHLPDNLQNHVRQLLQEYETQSTPEARFVKAIDKFEPLVHLYNEDGKKLTNEIGLTLADSKRIKEPYVEDFPTLKLFTNTMHEVMATEGFFRE